MPKILICFFCFALAACWPGTHRATADVPGDAKVSLIIRPMAGWHSDWYRKLVIDTPAGSLEEKLFEDTGWWRGSNLYLHVSGVYMLHEGQAGCVLFTISPPVFVTDTPISCDKTNHASAFDGFQDGNALAGFPPSRFYNGFRYIGHFSETPRQREAITFTGADQQPEPELPDIL